MPQPYLHHYINDMTIAKKDPQSLEMDQVLNHFSQFVISQKSLFIKYPPTFSFPLLKYLKLLLSYIPSVMVEKMVWIGSNLNVQETCQTLEFLDILSSHFVNIKSISFGGCLSHGEVSNILSHLNISNIQILSLPRTRSIDFTDFNELLILLKMGNLVDISISCDGFVDDMLTQLITSLHCCQKLKSLSLSYLTLNDEAEHGFTNVLLNDMQLTTLNLKGVRFENLDYIRYYLEQTKSLQIFVFENCQLDWPDSIGELITTLGRNNTIIQLSLIGDCWISDMDFIFETLQSNLYLQDLIIGHTETNSSVSLFSPDFLITYFKNNHTLNSISMPGCYISYKQMLSVINVLRFNTTLTCFDIDLNVTDAEKLRLQPLLNTNMTLTKVSGFELDTCIQSLRDKQCKDLFIISRYLLTMKCLSLDICRMMFTITLTPCFRLSDRSCIIEVLLDRCSIGMFRTEHHPFDGRNLLVACYQLQQTKSGRYGITRR